MEVDALQVVLFVGQKRGAEVGAPILRVLDGQARAGVRQNELCSLVVGEPGYSFYIICLARFYYYIILRAQLNIFLFVPDS